MPLNDHGATMLIGDSHDPEIRDCLVTQLNGREVDALILDGDHRVDGIRADLADYGPLVRPGGVILLHDIASESDDRAEVWKLWPELRKRFETSEICAADEPRAGWGVIHVHDTDNWITEGTPDGEPAMPI
jgi:hypothetical protein